MCRTVFLRPQTLIPSAPQPQNLKSPQPLSSSAPQPSSSSAPQPLSSQAPEPYSSAAPPSYLAAKPPQPLSSSAPQPLSSSEPQPLDSFSYPSGLKYAEPDEGLEPWELSIDSQTLYTPAPQFLSSSATKPLVKRFDSEDFFIAQTLNSSNPQLLAPSAPEVLGSLGSSVPQLFGPPDLGCAGSPDAQTLNALVKSDSDSELGASPSQEDEEEQGPQAQAQHADGPKMSQGKANALRACKRGEGPPKKKPPSRLDKWKRRNNDKHLAGERKRRANRMCRVQTLKNLLPMSYTKYSLNRLLEVAISHIRAVKKDPSLAQAALKPQASSKPEMVGDKVIREGLRSSSSMLTLEFDSELEMTYISPSMRSLLNIRDPGNQRLSLPFFVHAEDLWKIQSFDPYMNEDLDSGESQPSGTYTLRFRVHGPYAEDRYEACKVHLVTEGSGTLLVAEPLKPACDPVMSRPLEVQKGCGAHSLASGHVMTTMRSTRTQPSADATSFGSSAPQPLGHSAPHLLAPSGPQPYDPFGYMPLEAQHQSHFLSPMATYPPQFSYMSY